MINDLSKDEFIVNEDGEEEEGDGAGTPEGGDDSADGDEEPAM